MYLDSRFLTENSQIHVLDNGIVLIHSLMKALPISHCGYFFSVGTKDEESHLEGIAHFIEHSIFKGTKHRKAKQILTGIDQYGGELNAYTGKEETCVYATIPSNYLEKAVDLLSDMVFNSVFPEEEIEKEKKVILDEIQSYLDSPSDLIFEDFESLIFEHHPLERKILGTETSLTQIHREDLLNFVKKHYRPELSIFSYVGDLDCEKVLKILKKSTKNLSKNSEILTKKKSFENWNYQPKSVQFEKATHQVHAIIGGPAPSYADKNHHVMTLVQNILGGPNLNSLLNINIREKYGFVYSIEAHHNVFQQEGYFCIYFGTDVKYLSKMERLVLKELKKLREQKMSEKKLNMAKKQYQGQLLIHQENGIQRMLDQAKHLHICGKNQSLMEIFEKINLISVLDIEQILEQYFKADQFSFLTYQ